MEQGLGWSLLGWTTQAHATEPHATEPRDAAAMGVRPCSERRMLWEDFRLAFKLHAYANGLVEASPCGPESADAFAWTKRTRASLENRWDAYCRHLVEHGCRNELLPAKCSADTAS